MAHLAALPEPLQQRLRAELNTGESLLWTGQPSPRRYMKDAFKLWFFFIPWTAFSLFWMAGASGFRLPSFEDGWSLFPLFGLPFLLIGIAGLSSPFWLRRKAAWIVYGLTNRRALIIAGKDSITVKSYQIADIGELERTEHADGSGDVIFERESVRDSRGRQQTTNHGFIAVPEVRSVAQLLEKMTVARPA
ncbi:hypothetical protein G4G28_18220 [Massilia sp. Dwa41.01b]|uniref:hypothetical protein n=1 Tax=unclassified Massilia TaxID=2609279 RepID=UPI0015FECE38|nr:MULTISPECIES: hypothetical protein [unclassified Massilia]QNA89948.1 hypothetical protein G4G28_18220 [Massilia sp. Dwa41.01b]QNB00830.1 hypothetical protein G4G31_21780 [Massilia sp. Se16.2.3]